MAKKDVNLYRKHLKELQLLDREINLIVDSNKEDTDWIQAVRRKRKKKK